MDFCCTDSETPIQKKNKEFMDLLQKQTRCEIIPV